LPVSGGRELNEWTASCHDPIDEILEVVWTIEENRVKATAERIMSMNFHVEIGEEHLKRAVEEGYLKREGDVFVFTETGSKRGEGIIRRHRLAERLLVDVLNMREMSIESNACCFEHFLSPEVTDHICTLLGHPRKCPHEKPIPVGDCCIRAEKSLETVVVPLSELHSGESGRIVYISTQYHQRLDRLSSLGLFPGRVVRVHQREPLFVVFLDETQLALEREIVDEIHVLRS
jgi:DtxR family Mn-dependent transcriptional regulator